MLKAILTFIPNLLGIGGKFLENKQKLTELKQVQQFKIVEAETTAIVSRITNNNASDNEIDLITARNKKYTLKDEVITYLFLTPVFIATLTPFIVSHTNNDWINLDQYVISSYSGLNELPDWYKYVLGAVVIDVLGFRSFARKIVEKIIEKRKLK